MPPNNTNTSIILAVCVAVLSLLIYSVGLPLNNLALAAAGPGVSSPPRSSSAAAGAASAASAPPNKTPARSSSSRSGSGGASSSSPATATAAKQSPAAAANMALVYRPPIVVPPRGKHTATMIMLREWMEKGVVLDAICKLQTRICDAVYHG
jgi:hypothetical protein